MNIKESFRYQKFLDVLMSKATEILMYSDTGLRITKTHLRSKVDPSLSDEIEEVPPETEYDVGTLMKISERIIEEKEKLTIAIDKAKSSADFDIEAAIQASKHRQGYALSLRSMLERCKASESIEKGRGYRFNVEGNETPYTYDIQVIKDEVFDRSVCKKISQKMYSDADRMSEKIDVAMTTIQVDYNPPFSVNSTFKDIVEDFEESV